MAITLDPVTITATRDPSPELTVKTFDERVWRITVAGAELPANLNCDFTIEKSKRAEDPNSCKLQIFNLSSTTRESLAGLSLSLKKNDKGTGKGSFKTVGPQSGNIRVEIEAGYKSVGSSLLFRGDLRTASSERSGTDIVTTIWGEDGGGSVLASRVQASFGPGTTYEAVARFCAARMGVGIGNLPAVFNGGLPGVNIPDAMNFPDGTILSGAAVDELRKLLRSLDVSFSIQDGVVQCRTPKGFIPTTRVVLSPTSGLIGSPVKDSMGLVRATCLIQPGLFIDGRVRFQSQDFKGDFVIVNCDYQGSTYSKPWYAQIQCK
jgi:hypothetical protein